MYSNSFIALKSVWIEQQTPIFDAQFFSWFVDYVITPLYNETVKSRTDCGHDFTWCGAAKIWNDLKFQAFLVRIINPQSRMCVYHASLIMIIDASLLIGLFHSIFPSMFHDGLFTNRKTWYAESSGTCRKDSSLSFIFLLRLCILSTLSFMMSIAFFMLVVL
mmetsp:Transcript_3841/g.5439  ORF Transcript_3841/g.5439 Transcript_3841/m.5439 type:complete len:162 (+) Transcript_3841:532-1017(+)